MASFTRRDDLERRLELIENNWVGMNKDIHQVAAILASGKGGTVELKSLKNSDSEEVD